MRKRREPLATMVDFFLDADLKEAAVVYRILGLIVEKRNQQSQLPLSLPRRTRRTSKTNGGVAVQHAQE